MVDTNIANRQKEIYDTLKAMCHQEACGYIMGDYMEEHTSPQSPVGVAMPLHTEMIDADCRDKMVEWCYQVVDFCKLNRETVEIALSYVDRFMLTPAATAAKNDRDIFQLAFMTCLYTAVKIHEVEAIDPAVISTLSRGKFSPQQVESMEYTILTALKWRMNPPTSLAFVRLFIDLLPDNILTPQMLQVVSDLTKYQSELSVRDCRFIATQSSVVAFCAFMNSMESVGLDVEVLGHVGYMLSQTINVDCNDAAIIHVQNTLYEVVMKQPAALSRCVTPTYNSSPKTAGLGGPIEVSPRAVSD